MRDKYGVERDIYCYLNSSVLINLFNIKDESLLEEAEVEFSSTRAQEYQPTFESFDFKHYKAIHHQLFQDVYDWLEKLGKLI